MTLRVDPTQDDEVPVNTTLKIQALVKIQEEEVREDHHLHLQ